MKGRSNVSGAETIVQEICDCRLRILSARKICRNRALCGVLPIAFVRHRGYLEIEFSYAV
jgi:hypothetical protein